MMLALWCCWCWCFYVADYGTQTTGFQIFANSTDGSHVYTDTTPEDEYGDGIFNLTFEPELTAHSLIVLRSTEYLTICEFEAYEGKMMITLQGRY